jgi:hypothetical protein
MHSPDEPATFFNRPHAIQGAQILATVFCMLGVIFAGMDALSMGRVRPSTLSWDAAAVVLSAIAGALARRSQSAIGPLLAGSAMGLLYLGASWLLAKGGT